MSFVFLLLFSVQLAFALTSQHPYDLWNSSSSVACQANLAGNASFPLISERTSSFIGALLDRWNSTGLAVAVVQKLPHTAHSSTPDWKIEYGSYGLARTSNGKGREDATNLVTPDTLFSIASNSKLFLAISVGLIISNKTLAESFQKRTGKKLGWWTRMKDLMPDEWVFQDKEIENGATIQDLLSHRTGMPRHDAAHPGRKEKDASKVVPSFRYLRSSATFRQTFQYNNMMYEALSLLPPLFLNQPYESYLQEHLFDPLNMSSTTFSVERAEGELGDRFAEGHVQHLRDVTRNETGWLKPIVPHFDRPGQEKVWAGAGGVISTARDLSTWIAMLLNDGRHPFSNNSVVPAEVMEFVSTGLVATHGKPEFPETSVKVYGAGQWRYSYQGHDLIEHGGAVPGFRTQVTRFPGSSIIKDSVSSYEACSGTENHGLGIITLSNDGERGDMVHDATKLRIADDVLGLKKVDWASRYQKSWDNFLDSLRKKKVPPPVNPRPPSGDFQSLGASKFKHPVYGTLIPCLVPVSTTGVLLKAGEDDSQSLFSVPSVSTEFENPNTNCTHLLSLPSSKRILQHSLLDRPTYLIQWDRLDVSTLRLTHFDGNLFNITTSWSNANIRRDEGYPSAIDQAADDDGDVLVGLDSTFEVEWVHPGRDVSSAYGDEEEGLSFRGNFWGKGESPAEEPRGGLGRESAEVWFGVS